MEGDFHGLPTGVLFRKRFTPRPSEQHVDFGCNVEFYCNDRFIEMETLGPIARLAPGDGVHHVETWEFTTGVTSIESLPP